jgi:hypothetical protein
MAITINGTAGTLAGIVVGGLPDGIVDDGTLATSSVTSTKIADGTIVNADINSSAAIAASKLTGTGKVLQVVTARLTGSANATSTVYIASGLEATITPSSTSSKILVFVNGGKPYIASGNLFVALYKGGALLKGNWYAPVEAVSGSVMGIHSASYLDSPASTSALTYSLWWKSSTSTLSYFQDSPSVWGETTITLMEIGA